MTKTNDKIDALLAKHPNLTKDEAIKIFADKNARKKKKRSEKAERANVKKLKREREHLENQTE